MENNNYATNKFLMKVGISPEISGYYYLIEAINTMKKAILNGEVNYKFTALYAQIGKKFNISAARVERAIRHSIEKAFSNNNAMLHKIFDSLIDYESGKVVNSCFVCTIAQYLIMEENED